MTGAIEGRFIALFQKLSKLHSKNSFSLGIILGDLFANPTESSSEDEAVSTLLKGNITVPFSIYFTLGNHPLPQQVVEKLEKSDGEVCPNLYFLGKRSTTKTSEGLRIVALGGSLDAAVTAGLSKDKYLPFHTEDDAKALRGANTADVLITSQWPLSVRTGSKVNTPDGAEEPPAERCIADLCSTLRPRYHFSPSNQIFYEREPFCHAPKEEQPDTKQVTRFISLAAFDNPVKQKWLYAFSIDPNAAVSPTIPIGTTISPFTDHSKKRQRLPPQDQYFSRFSNHDRHRPPKRARQAPPTPGECFFCLSNPNLATHLITSIADNTYLTTAKGPLSDASTFPALGFPAHTLIIPLSHSPTLASISDTEVRAATYNEIHQYRRALHNLLIEKAKGGLGAVTWEVCRAEGIHIHWQFLPVPSDLITKGLVEAAFKVEAENEKYPMFKNKDIGDGTAEKGDYFRVWVWQPGEGEQNGGQSTLNATHHWVGEGETGQGKDFSLVLPLSPDFRFDLQFGRRVMAKLLQLEARMSWRDCQQSEAEETLDAEAFKKAFKEFDFSLES